jgi:hypothetical protein
MGRLVAKLPGKKRPEKQTEVIAVDRWVLAVCPLVLEIGRQRAVTSLGCLSIGLLLMAKVSDSRSIFLIALINHSLCLGTCQLFHQKTQAIFAGSVAWPDCRRCAALGHDTGAEFSDNARAPHHGSFRMYPLLSDAATAICLPSGLNVKP